MNKRLKYSVRTAPLILHPHCFSCTILTYGNESLKPEENTTFEGGLELFSKMDLRISVVYFNRKESNFIDFVNVDPKLFLYQYENVNEEFMVDGVEVELQKALEIISINQRIIPSHNRTTEGLYAFRSTN